MLINFIGQCGPVLGTRLYPKHEGPRYAKGMSICAAFMFLAAFVSLALRFFLIWENKRLDRRYSAAHTPDLPTKATPGDGNGVVVGEENYGPRFRYVL